MFLSRYAFKSPLKRLLVCIFDLLGSASYSVFRLFKKESRRAKIERILLIRLDHIGDVVMTRPAEGLLEKYFPEAEIDWLVSDESAELLRGSLPSSGNVFSESRHWFSRKARFAEMIASWRRIARMMKHNSYDLAIDFRGDLRNILLMAYLGIPRRIGYGITGGGFLLTDCIHYHSSLHQIDLNAALLKPLGITQSPEIIPFSHGLPKKKVLLDQLSSVHEKKIVIQTGAGYPSKIWPQENFLELIKRLCLNKNAKIILIGTRTEKELLSIEGSMTTSMLDLRGETQLEDLPYLFDMADLFIGNDSGPAHIAATQGIPVLCIFSGANRVSVWQPRGPRVKVLYRKISCSPCHAQICPLQHHECMRTILVEEVLSHAERLLRGDDNAAV